MSVKSVSTLHKNTASFGNDHYGQPPADESSDPPGPFLALLTVQPAASPVPVGTLSNQAFSAAIAQAMQTSIARLNADYNSGASTAKVQDDLATYYGVQTSVRGYASLAASVATNTSFNGQVPNSEIETAFHDSQYGSNELKVAVSLANQDWNLVTNNGSLSAANTLYIPTIVGDDYEHNVVFSENPGLSSNDGVNNWGGTPSALLNDNWIGSGAKSYEVSNATSQSSVLGSSANLDASVGNLTAAGFYQFFFNPGNTAANIGQVVGDLPTLGAIFSQIYSEGVNKSVYIGDGITLSGSAGTFQSASINAIQLDTGTGSKFGAGTITSENLAFLSGGLQSTYLLASGASMIELIGSGQVLANSVSSVINVIGGASSITGSSDVINYLLGGLTSTVAGNTDSIIGTATTTGTVNGSLTSGTFDALTYLGTGANINVGAWSSIHIGAVGSDAIIGSNLAVTDSYAGTLSFAGVGNTFAGVSNDLATLAAGAGLTVSSNGGTYSFNSAGSALVDNGSGAVVNVNSINEYLSASNVAVYMNSTGSDSLIGSYTTLTDNAANTVYVSGGVGNTYKGLASDITAIGTNTGLTVNSSGGTFDLNAPGCALVDTSSGGTIGVYSTGDYVQGSNQTVNLSNTGSVSLVGGYLSVFDTAANTTYVSGGVGDTYKGLASDVTAIGANTGLTVNSSGGTFDANGSGCALVDTSSSATVGVFNNGDYVNISNGLVDFSATNAALSLVGGHDSFGLSPYETLYDQGTTQQLDSTTGYGYSSDKAIFDDTSNGYSDVQVVNPASNVTLNATVYTNFNDNGTPLFINNDYTNGESISTWNNPAGQPGVLKAIEGFTGPNDTGSLAYQSLTLQGGGSSLSSFYVNGDFRFTVFGPSGTEDSSGLFNALKQLIQSYFGSPSGTAYVPSEQDDQIGNGYSGYYSSAASKSPNATDPSRSAAGRGIETLVPWVKPADMSAQPDQSSPYASTAPTYYGSGKAVGNAALIHLTDTQPAALNNIAAGLSKPAMAAISHSTTVNPIIKAGIKQIAMPTVADYVKSFSTHDYSDRSQGTARGMPNFHDFVARDQLTAQGVGDPGNQQQPANAVHMLSLTDRFDIAPITHDHIMLSKLIA